MGTTQPGAPCHTCLELGLDSEEFAIHKVAGVPRGRITPHTLRFLDPANSQLVEACTTNDVALVDACLEVGATVHTYDENRTGLLHVAARHGNAATAEALIRYGCTVDMTDCAGWTCLHVAARRGQPEIVRMLLASGAKPWLRTARGHTAAELARDQATRRAFEAPAGGLQHYGRLLFNSDPERGLRLILSLKGIEKDSEKIAEELFYYEGLEPVCLSSVLSKQPQALHCFIGLLEFTGQSFVEALHTLLTKVALPDEGVAVSQILTAFAYWYAGSSVYSSKEVYALAMSTVLLDSSLKSSSAMTFEEFAESAGNVDAEELRSIYDHLISEPLPSPRAARQQFSHTQSVWKGWAELGAQTEFRRLPCVLSEGFLLLLDNCGLPEFYIDASSQQLSLGKSVLHGDFTLNSLDKPQHLRVPSLVLYLEPSNKLDKC